MTIVLILMMLALVFTRLAFGLLKVGLGFLFFFAAVGFIGCLLLLLQG